MEWERILYSVFGSFRLIFPVGSIQVELSPGRGIISLIFHVDVQVWWLPWAHEGAWWELLSLGCLFHSQYEKAALAFQLEVMLCLEKNIFWLSKDWTTKVISVCMKWIFSLFITSFYVLGTVVLGSCNIVKCAACTLYIGLFRIVSSLGQGPFGFGVCAASSTVGLVRHLYVQYHCENSWYVKVWGQLKLKKKKK